MPTVAAPKAARAHLPARALLAVLAFVLGLGTIPHRVCERDAGAYYDGDARQVDALAASVGEWTAAELAPTSFATGSRRFDGEWLFGTYMMAAMGFGQVALATDDPVRRAESVARMERCLDAMLAPASRVFDRDAWSLDALASLDARPGSAQDRGHAAYLGYAGLALGLHRLVAPTSRFDRTHDALAAALARRFHASATGLVETYPGEVYPVDNAAALGALALHAKATRALPSAGLQRGLETLRTRAVQPATGLLAQAASAEDGRPRDPGRGSGTALAAYFLAYADPALSAALYQAVHRELFRTVVGFGAVLEHPASCVECTGRVDIDSGPVFLGFGVSATGFALGASRVNEDRDAFVSLYATAHLFGAPFDEGASRTFATGGPLGDAILFAMVTAPRRAVLARLGGELPVARSS
ncbi:MAG TPA: hypothetical protein VLT33_06310 [Labilithrix sp.]|nr:hypothetical protein [Labilithrix sp.]